uniref:Uncharacterized protein n=1 Tax=Amphimedon queenslandica TaxID=400682 RepID=A0A1X7V562_AMPQE
MYDASSNPAKLSEHSKLAVAVSFTKPLLNEDRKRLRKMFPTPDLPETKCPRLDTVFKSTAVRRKPRIRMVRLPACKPSYMIQLLLF